MPGLSRDFSPCMKVSTLGSYLGHHLQQSIGSD
jgi:hypothetical protein